MGESLSPRIASKVELVTGALPAQFGLNGGGVVNVTTKDGIYLDGGQAELYGGGRAEIEPAFEYGGSIGSTNFFASGSYLRNHLGLASPDGSGHPLHDQTQQYEGLAYVDRVLDPQTRIALVVGASDERFQLPNLRGLNAATANLGPLPFQRPLVLSGISNFPSEARDGTRHDLNRYGVVSLLHTSDTLTLQLAGFARFSAANLSAGATGDILFTGVGRDTRDTTTSLGLQLEGAYELAPAHTMRFGTVIIADIHKGYARTDALPIDAGGVQIADAPRRFDEATRLATRKDGVFIEDEWRPGAGLTVNIGGRVDHIAAVDDLTRFSPRVSVVWQPQPETTMHAGYARYFIPAPIDGIAEQPGDLAGTTARLPTATGNQPLPEFDDYYDIGAQRNVDAFTLALDAYWRRATHLIDEGVFGVAGQSASFNYRKGRVRGIEISLTYNAGRLSGWANIALAEAKAQGIASNQYYFSPVQLAYADSRWIQTANSQSITMSGGLSYRVGTVRLSTDMLYGSGLPRSTSPLTLNDDHLPGYVQVNLSAVWRVAQIKRLPLDVRIDIINAFDRRYALSDGTALGASQPQWGPRRTALVGLEQSF
nr:TonB-dependent receptor [Sphingomonas vulcanisoli]